MTTPPRLVDWRLAERVGGAIAASGSDPVSIPAAEVDRAAARADDLVAVYTRLAPRGAIPRAETVDRGQWVHANLVSFREMSEEAERRLLGSLQAPELIRSALRRLAGPVLGAQLGLAAGYVGRRVLAQYEIAVIGPPRPARLLFVGPNLAAAQRRLGEPREKLLIWIALHEATHAYQFEAVPWLRRHVATIVEELLAATSVTTDVSELRGALRHLLPPTPGRVVERLREGGVVRLLAGPEQVRLIERLEAAMTVIEGYAEHVMDAIGAELDPGYARLRAAADAERQRRGTLDAIVATLLGLGIKIRQYELGKRFADAVVDRAGIDGLNAVWRSPAELPSHEEIEHPERWLARVAAADRAV